MSAVVAVLTMLVGLSMFGDTPDTRDDTATVAAWFTDHRTSVFVGVVLVAVSMMAVLALAARLAERLGAADRPAAGRLVQSATTVAAGIVVIGILVPYAGLAYIIGSDSPDMAKGLFDLTLAATPILALTLAVAIGTVAVGEMQGGRSSRWLTWSSLAAAAVLVWSGCSFAARGPMSPDVQQSVVFEVLTAWLGVAGIVIRHPRRGATRPGRRQPMMTG